MSGKIWEMLSNMKDDQIDLFFRIPWTLAKYLVCLTRKEDSYFVIDRTYHTFIFTKHINKNNSRWKELLKVVIYLPLLRLVQI